MLWSPGAVAPEKLPVPRAYPKRPEATKAYVPPLGAGTIVSMVILGLFFVVIVLSSIQVCY